MGGRGGKPDPTCDLGVAHPAVGLEQAQDRPIRLVYVCF
jgi:hypothetical protein